MPAANKAKAVFDHGKTSSYHIKSIADCQQSQKSSSFKLVLNRASGAKRYDFEAESPKMAGMCYFLTYSFVPFMLSSFSLFLSLLSGSFWNSTLVYFLTGIPPAKRLACPSCSSASLVAFADCILPWVSP